MGRRGAARFGDRHEPPRRSVGITGGHDRTARLWEAATGQELAGITLDAGVGAINVYAGAIVLSDGLGRIHVFDADEPLT